jgi:hypothetical protein
LRDVNRIKPDLLDKEFLVNLPTQILETLEMNKNVFDEMVCGKNQNSWAIKKSKIVQENESSLKELHCFLESLSFLL